MLSTYIPRISITLVFAFAAGQGVLLLTGDQSDDTVHGATLGLAGLVWVSYVAYIVSTVLRMREER